MDYIANILSNPFLVIVGGISTLVLIIRMSIDIWLYARGIAPFLYRLGRSLSRRKIAIFSTSARYDNLEKVLTDSRLFPKKNITNVTPSDPVLKNNETIFLVDWESFDQGIEEVFSCRKDGHTAIIILAKRGSIEGGSMDKILEKENTVIVNSKGRLLNDILTSMITTFYGL